MSQLCTRLFWTLYAWMFSLDRFQINILNEKTQSIINRKDIYIYTKCIYIYIYIYIYYVTKVWQWLAQADDFLLVLRAPGFIPWFWCCSSVVFSWYPEHLGLPPNFGVAHQWFSPGTPSTWVYCKSDQEMASV